MKERSFGLSWETKINIRPLIDSAKNAQNIGDNEQKVQEKI